MSDKKLGGMTKDQIIKRIGDHVDKLQADGYLRPKPREIAREALEALEVLVADELASTGVIRVPGIVRLARVDKPAGRIGRNPQNGMPMELPAKTAVKATAAGSLVTAVLTRRGTR
ncbi:MAG: HU family DNA-binding protein [Rhodospirillales bacterium]|nr:HU family DNA-binding protein [Rhodospirillales bacterium]